MLEIIKAIIYGIVEGITEWLPISSTGHLILVERLIPFQQTSEGFFDMFDVVIQLGAILAVVVLFWNKIWPFYLKKNKQPKKGGIVTPLLPISFWKASPTASSNNRPYTTAGMHATTIFTHIQKASMLSATFPTAGSFADFTMPPFFGCLFFFR